jgi:hypothetical protein
MNKQHIPFASALFLALVVILFPACERDLEDLEPVSYPANPYVFIDGFSAGLNYAAFGGSVPTAFDVDNNETYNNSAASMRFDVPDAGDPRGAYAGGVFFTEGARDLSSYNAITFWAKASRSAQIDLVGFGNDLGANKYQASISNLGVNTAWKKYIIPIPDPSRLSAERGMFFYSEGPDENGGYTFWIDEVQFENLGTIAHPQFAILSGEDQEEISFIGVNKNIGGLTAIFNLPSGIDQEVNTAAAYFSFQTSNPGIATVDEFGKVSVVGGPGEAVITAAMGELPAEGSLTIQSAGIFEPAPLPAQDPANVISLFSDAYPNVPVDYYNGYWAPYQTTLSADFEVNGDHILHYTNFNFVGIEFSSPTIDASSMTHLHLDIFLPNALSGDAQFKIEVLDQASGTTGAHTIGIPVSQSNQWISFDIPFASFAGLTGRTSLFQIIFSDVLGNISSFYADNLFFYNDGASPAQPTSPAPVPGHSAANVVAVYSDAYSVIPGTDLNPNWGQATAYSQIQIQGNNTIKYANLNYQGIQLGSSQDVSAMEYLHLDFWSSNSTMLKVFLISTGPVEQQFTLNVPTTGWTSLDIPLSSFAPVDLTDVIQLKFEGNGDIFLDNLYFRKN